MKLLKKMILAGVFSYVLAGSTFPCVAKTPNLHITEPTSQLSPKADKLEWKFKMINGQWYRRLYNATQKKWIGDWEPV